MNMAFLSQAGLPTACFAPWGRGAGAATLAEAAARGLPRVAPRAAAYGSIIP